MVARSLWTNWKACQRAKNTTRSFECQIKPEKVDCGFYGIVRDQVEYALVGYQVMAVERQLALGNVFGSDKKGEGVQSVEALKVDGMPNTQGSFSSRLVVSYIETK